MARDRRKGGRVTPPKQPGGRPAAGAPRRRFQPPNKPVEGPVQAGRRPSSPGKLLLLALMWIACGVYAIVALHAGWRFIPGIVFIGVGLLFLRGAAATVARRSDADQRSGEPDR